MSVFCSNCGNVLPPNARFCSLCGTVAAGAPPMGYPPYPFPYSPRLMRPIFGRQIAGVCAALARTYGWDVGLVRILAVVGAFALCPFVEIAYIAGWIGIPEEPFSVVVPPPPPV